MISNSNMPAGSPHNQSVSSNDIAQERFIQNLSQKNRNHRPSMSSIAAYLGVFLMVMSLVALGYQPPQRDESLANVVQPQTVATPKAVAEDTSVDNLVATNVAAGIAERANLPVANNIANLNQSLEIESNLVQTSTKENAIAKPQIVQPTAGNREIQQYTTKAGDTVESVATEFNISPTTIKWANNLSSDALEPNKVLKILPIEGVLYTVKDGDTVDSIAQKYKADTSSLVSFNDLELGGLAPNRQLIIPDGDLPEQDRPGYTAPVAAPARNSYGYGNYGGGDARYNNMSMSAGNRYAFGNCTWYVYERRAQLGRPVGSFWGNASSWVYSATSAGLGVGKTPQPGSIMQNGGGYGHVAIVESVNPGVSITISEMNGYRFGGGFNRIARGNIPWGEATSGMYTYIY